MSVVVEVLLLYGAALSAVKAFFPRSPTDENVHRKTTRPRPRNVVNRQEQAMVLWAPPDNAAIAGAGSPALPPARETALVVWSPPTDLRFALGAGTSRYLRTLVFPSSGVENPFPRQTPISEITGLRMVTNAHRSTPAVLLLGTSQPSPWYPVRLATERCPLPIAPANSASCGEEDEELPTAAAPPVTGVSIVGNVVGQLGIDLVVPAFGMAVSARAGRRAAARSSSVLRALENSRCDATAAVAGQQPRQSSTESRGRTSATGERRTRNSSRSRSPSPPPRSRGRPQSPLRSASPAPRPVAVGVFPYRPVAPSRPLAMENPATDDDICAVSAMTTSPLIPPPATWPATGGDTFSAWWGSFAKKKKVSPATRPSTTYVREAPFKIDTSYRANFAKIKAGVFDDNHSACFSRSLRFRCCYPRGNGAAAARTSASQKKGDKKKNIMHMT